MDSTELRVLFERLRERMLSRYDEELQYGYKTFTHFAAEPQEAFGDPEKRVVAASPEELFDRLPYDPEKGMWFYLSEPSGETLPELLVNYRDGAAEYHWINEGWMASEENVLAMLSGKRAHVVFHGPTSPLVGDIVYLVGGVQDISCEVSFVSQVPEEWTVGTVWVATVHGVEALR